ncbi:MAG: DUF3440 domain-containing protein [Bilophila wadsworthia]
MDGHRPAEMGLQQVYDLMHLVGVGITKCASASRTVRSAQGLWLFKMLEPETWSRVVGRVQGANRQSLCGTFRKRMATSVSAFGGAHDYAEFLLAPCLHRRSTTENQHLFEMVGEARFRRNSAGSRTETGVPPQSPKLAAYLPDIAENDYWCKG